jgi:hypothetical protein
LSFFNHWSNELKKQSSPFLQTPVDDGDRRKSLNRVGRKIKFTENENPSFPFEWIGLGPFPHGAVAILPDR